MTAIQEDMSQDGNMELPIKKVTKRKPGIIYLSSIPSSMNVIRIREYFSNYGQISNLYLEANRDKSAKKGSSKSKKRLKFSEGWVEFKSKRKAKFVHSYVNKQPVGGNKKNPDFDVLWNIKYLPRFKWAYLKQRLEYERQVRRQRMNAEIAQVTKETDHYIRASEVGDKLKKKMKREEKMEITEGKFSKKDITASPKQGYIFQQKLTGTEIVKKNELRKLKNEQYKKQIEKKKKKKQEFKTMKKEQPDDFLHSVFVGSQK